MTIRTALLMNFVAPYRRPLLEQLQARVGELRIFVSTTMEANRPWPPEWGALDVVVQQTLTIPAKLDRPSGIRQQLYLHFSIDTWPLLIRYDPELVISGELGMRSLQAAIFRVLRRKSRLVIWATLSEHTEKDWGSVRRALRRFILRRADAVVVNGQSGARYIATLNRNLPVIVMRQPAVVSLFSRCPSERSPQQARQLIYSGRLIQLKGVQEAQAEIAQWARAHPERLVEMIWVGDGDLRQALEQAPVPENFRQTFYGHVDQDVLAGHYGRSGALILPTMFDEWALVVNEALASSIPVLGSIYSQAVEELVEEGVNGWQFDPLRAGTLRAALDRFFAASLGELATMRAAARRTGLSVTPASAVEHLMAGVEALPMSARRRRFAQQRAKLAG